MGFVRSEKVEEREPLAIRSKPSAIAQSTIPEATALRACNNAVEPVEQLLLTFMIGICVQSSGLLAVFSPCVLKIPESCLVDTERADQQCYLRRHSRMQRTELHRMLC